MQSLAMEKLWSDYEAAHTDLNWFGTYDFGSFAQPWLMMDYAEKPSCILISCP